MCIRAGLGGWKREERKPENFQAARLRVMRAGRTAMAVFLAYSMAVLPVSAQGPGGTITNGTSTSPFLIPAFLFEPEVPFASLKAMPTWNELEQLLDNPYAVTAACSDSHGLVPGNESGFPSYCSAIVRRPSFGGVLLPPLLVHPLNYNPTNGEEMRLLNPDYPGGGFQARSTCICTPPGVTFPPGVTAPPPCGRVSNGVLIGGVRYGCAPPANPIKVTAGSGRVAETEIDYNSPFGRNVGVCVSLVENPEGAILCGGDPGEPLYPPDTLTRTDNGFGVGVSNGGTAWYSTAAVPLLPATRTPGTVLTASNKLRVGPADCAERNLVSPGSCTGGVINRLLKPTIRPTPTSPPNYLVNSAAALAADPAAIKPSNENDYVRNRDEAMALGKALFWDMQVGSDGVQACGSCHFAAGADNRTKNQMNPNHIGGDTTFEIGQLSPTLQGANHDLVASDFPFHKLSNPEIAGDTKCSPAITANVSAVPYGAPPFGHPVSGTVTVCDKANATNLRADGTPQNDVASSMGVKFGKFTDIPPVGTLVANASGVSVVPPDLRSPLAADNLDPIPGFAGTLPSTDPNFGHQFRRVEPRNTPTFFLAAANFDNFWDGRARHDFNGGSVFGAADPQAHVFAGTTDLVATRQIIRFVSLASLATGPGLSEFEMSRMGRNWAKIGKKLLQAGVTPLANQLVAVDDSILGRYSNQGGSACGGLAADEKSPGTSGSGKPGLCISYPGLIRRAFYPALWGNSGAPQAGGAAVAATAHLNGAPAPCTSAVLGVLTPAGCDPFDGYVLSIAPGPAAKLDTNQFTQMEANFSLFWGLSIHLWGTILVPDNTPFDQFLDANPDAFRALGEPGEPGLVSDLPRCTSSTQRNCFTEFGDFKRDVGSPLGGGTRTAGTVDPLLGMDIFFASNLSLKNPNFRSARCGECHAVPTLTDHTMPFTFKTNLRDFIAEFLPTTPPGVPPVPSLLEPLGRLRTISGFLLESELAENGQDAVERRIANQSIAPCETGVDAGLAFPGGLEPGAGTGFGRCSGAGASFFDNGVYNLGVTPCEANAAGTVAGRCDDAGRGGNDAFGWPLSLAALLMKNAAGPTFEPGVPMGTFNSALGNSGGLFKESAQDPGINPGFTDELVTPLLPAHLAPFAPGMLVGDAHPELDEAGGAPGGMFNTLTNIGMIEGFTDTLGPFNPAGIFPEALNKADGPLMGTWPVVNRVGRMGSIKAAQLREVELTGPYFHNGGKLTLRQVVDFYTRGGDFPVTNAQHRDFNLVNLNIELQSNLNEDEKVALVDFLLELTDDRVRHEKAPFDRPEVFVPLDGTAPENEFGRPGFLGLLSGVCSGGTGPCFRQVPAVGATGGPALPAFLGLSNTRLVGPAANCGPSPTSQYCR